MQKFAKNNGFIKLITIILASFVLICGSVNVTLAVEELTDVGETKREEKSDTKAQNENKTSEKKEEKQKKAEKPTLADGEAGVLVDAASGRILLEFDADKKMYPASTTKIMTALLAIEAIERGETSMDKMVTITADMLENADPDGSNIALKEGEIISLDSLLKGLIIPSGNDAACAIATHISGDIPTFVEKMNARAAELGAENTHFENPHGLHSSEHYTTASDMAKISVAAMKLDKFRNIADIAHIKIPPTNMTETERYYINTNGLLSTMRYTNFFLKGSIGIKTGYTSDAGNCLVSAASRNGVELIGVLFGGENAERSHNGSRDMLEWGFDEFVSVPAISGKAMVSEVKVKQGRKTDSLTLAAKETVNVVLPKGASTDKLEIVPRVPEAVYAPISVGTEIGEVSVMLDGIEIGRGKLVSTLDIERSIFWPAMAFGEWIWSFTLVRAIVYIIGGLIVAFVIMFVTAIYQNLKRAKKHRRKYERK